MRATVQPTDQLSRVNGQLCRVWEGVTDEGFKIFLYVRVLGALSDVVTEDIAAAATPEDGVPLEIVKGDLLDG